MERAHFTAEYRREALLWGESPEQLPRPLLQAVIDRQRDWQAAWVGNKWLIRA